LGDITGGVIGGGGTMLAVILSIHKTDEVGSVKILSQIHFIRQ